MFWISVHSSSGTLSTRSNPLNLSSPPLYNHKGFDLGYPTTEWPSSFLCFLQFEPEFCNKELIFWATVSSWSCFCWLYRSSLSLAAKKCSQSDFSIDDLVTFMCKVISCVVGKGCFIWPVCFSGIILLTFALLHFVLQGQTCLLLQVCIDFLLFC